LCLPSGHGWRLGERDAILSVAIVVAAAANKAVVLDVNHGHLLCRGEFVPL